MRAPEDKKQLQSFLVMVTYMGGGGFHASSEPSHGATETVVEEGCNVLMG